MRRLHPSDRRLIGRNSGVHLGVRSSYPESDQHAMPAGRNEAAAGGDGDCSADRVSCCSAASGSRTWSRRWPTQGEARRADVHCRGVQPVKRGRHLAHRLPHLRVIGEGELISPSAARLDQDALGWWRRHVQLMQDPLALPCLARIKLRQVLRSHQLPGQEGHADDAEPADDSRLCVPCAPQGDPLADRPAPVLLTPRHSPLQPWAAKHAHRDSDRWRRMAKRPGRSKLLHSHPTRQSDTPTEAVIAPEACRAAPRSTTSAWTPR